MKRNKKRLLPRLLFNKCKKKKKQQKKLKQKKNGACRRCVYVSSYLCVCANVFVKCLCEQRVYVCAKEKQLKRAERISANNLIYEYVCKGKC